MPSGTDPADGAVFDDAMLVLDFSGEVIEWRGPAPYHCIPLPEEDAAAVRDVAREVTYGWGVIPARAVIGGTLWTTSLLPKDGGYLLPLKDAVHEAERIDLGDSVDIQLGVVRP